MDVPDGLHYTTEHEWLRITASEEIAEIGITDFAQEQLGDVVFVQLPAIGATVERGAPFGEVESVKTVSEIYAPIAGEVVAINDALTEYPEYVNTAPYGDGWMLRIRFADPAAVRQLLTPAEYRDHIAGA